MLFLTVETGSMGSSSTVNQISSWDEKLGLSCWLACCFSCCFECGASVSVGLLCSSIIIVVFFFFLIYLSNCYHCCCCCFSFSFFFCFFWVWQLWYSVFFFSNKYFIQGGIEPTTSPLSSVSLDKTVLGVHSCFITLLPVTIYYNDQH